VTEATAVYSVRPPAAPERSYRMKDLCEATGLERQVIHFYIQQGLLPAGRKTGRNMAWYGEEHVARLKLIKKLQHERFLPLKAIKALLDGREEHFSDDQQRFLLDLKRELSTTIARGVDDRRVIADIAPSLEALGLSVDDVRELEQIGVLGATFEADGAILVAREDEWVLELLGTMRKAGWSAELGFRTTDLKPHVEAIDALVQNDADVVTERLSGLPPRLVARMMETMLPLLQQFLVRHYERRVRDLLSVM
jgi:DNA-binding transcriptional MerR regulator